MALTPHLTLGNLDVCVYELPEFPALEQPWVKTPPPPLPGGYKGLLQGHRRVIRHAPGS